MTDARARLNRVCNMRCVFCDSVAAKDGPGYTEREVLSRLTALRARTEVVTLTGGEPTLRGDLVRIVEAAAKMGFRDIILETNGMMLSYSDFADRLASAGVNSVRVSMTSHRAETADRITRRPGGWELTCRGVEQAESRFETVVTTPLLKETAGELAELVGFVGERFKGVRKIVAHLVAPTEGWTEKVCAADLEGPLRKVREAARKAGVALEFAPDSAAAPCCFEDPDSIAELFQFPPLAGRSVAGHRRVEACGDCFLAYHCPGLHPGLDESATARGLTPSFARLVLKQWPGRDRGTQRNVGRETDCVLSPIVEAEGAKRVEEVLLRLNYNCNQRCLFCWVEPGFENPPHEAVTARIRELSEYEIGSVCLTGGEPTLNPRLAEYVSALRGARVNKICLQTNAVLLEREEFARELAEAGLDFAFVSLHSHDAAVSDMLTGAAGTFEKTVRGILNLRERGVMVALSHVMNPFNIDALPRFVEFAHERLRSSPIMFLSAAPIYGAMMHQGLIPRMTRLKEPLRRAIDACYELGVPFSGLAAMCGIPLCILDGDPKCYPDMRPIPAGAGGNDMIKTVVCRECSLDGCCYGLRKHYAEFYGYDELRSIRIENFSPPAVDVWGTDYIAEYYTRVFNAKY